MSAADTKNDTALTAKKMLTGMNVSSAACDRPAADRERLGRSLHERVRLLHVGAVDKRRHGRAVGRREVARRSFEQERRDDQAPQRQRACEAGDSDGDQHDPPHEIGADHQPLSAEAVRSQATVQAEDERRNAVREPHGDDPQRPAGVEREPHQRDVVERIAELARRDREVQPPEVGAAQEVQRPSGRRRHARLELARDVENRV